MSEVYEKGKSRVLDDEQFPLTRTSPNPTSSLVVRHEDHIITPFFTAIPGKAISRINNHF